MLSTFDNSSVSPYTYDDLRDPVDGVRFVARFHPLRGVADRKVPPARHPGLPLQDRDHQ